jgi:hypothetical protein
MVVIPILIGSLNFDDDAVTLIRLDYWEATRTDRSLLLLSLIRILVFLNFTVKTNSLHELTEIFRQIIGYSTCLQGESVDSVFAVLHRLRRGGQNAPALHGRLGEIRLHPGNQFHEIAQLSPAFNLHARHLLVEKRNLFDH